MKKILILNMKHGKLYFDISTEEMKYNVANHIVKNINLNYYRHIINEPINPENTFTKPDNFSELPIEIQKHWNILENNKRTELRNYKSKLKHHELLKNCLNNLDKTSAWQLLQLRRDYEYEEFDIEHITEI